MHHVRAWVALAMFVFFMVHGGIFMQAAAQAEPMGLFEPWQGNVTNAQLANLMIGISSIMTANFLLFAMWVFDKFDRS